MSEILDQDYIYEYVELQFDDNGSGFLSVNQLTWRDELYKLERLRNITIIIGFIIFIFMMIFILPTRFYIFMIGIIVILQIRNSNSRMYSNLLNHGKYEYEVHKHKIVRYSDVNYLKFEFSEIKKAKVKKFGVVLFKHIDINSYLLNDKKQDLLVIPNKTQGYNQIVKHLIQENIL